LEDCEKMIADAPAKKAWRKGRKTKASKRNAAR